MRPSNSIAFRASRAPVAQDALAVLEKQYGQVAPADADVVVALGGDGFMLETLKEVQALQKPVYGMNRGTVGFLMNEFSSDDLSARLAAAEEAVINPLRMRAGRSGGEVVEGLAINEVSLLRQGPQAARLKISIDGRSRLEELVRGRGGIPAAAPVIPGRGAARVARKALAEG